MTPAQLAEAVRGWASRALAVHALCEPPCIRRFLDGSDTSGKIDEDALDARDDNTTLIMFAAHVREQALCVVPES